MTVPVSERAGTKIDHSYARRIYVTVDGRKVLCGLLDPSQSVYQAKFFAWWPENVAYLNVEELQQVAPHVSHVELIQHRKNDTRCWRISIEDARKGRWIVGKIGKRWAIPLDSFEVSD